MENTATYTVAFNTILSDVSLDVEGDLISGQTHVDGVVGNEIAIRLTFKEFVEADTPIESVKTTSGTVVSNTIVLGEHVPVLEENPWDVNSDLTVDIFDLVIVGANFGQTPPDDLAADVTGDGTVNIFDLVLVSTHFGESYGEAVAVPIALNHASSPAAVGLHMVAADVGDNLITVQVHADSAVELGGAQFNLHFDAGRLAFVEAKKGGLFEAQGSQSYWLTPKVTDGQLMLASSAIASSSPLASEDLATVLAQITFRVTSPDGDVSDAASVMESIRLGNVRIADVNGRSILTNWLNRVDVAPLKDFKNALLQNYPNPFNPETWIPYRLAEDGHVAIKVYDMFGSVVRTIDIGLVSAGEYVTKEHAAYWDGRNEQGEHVSSGVYFYTIEATGFVATKKLIIVK